MSVQRRGRDRNTALRQRADCRRPSRHLFRERFAGTIQPASADSWCLAPALLPDSIAVSLNPGRANRCSTSPRTSIRLPADFHKAPFGGAGLIPLPATRRPLVQFRTFPAYFLGAPSKRRSGSEYFQDGGAGRAVLKRRDIIHGLQGRICDQVPRLSEATNTSTVMPR
jgi:hypothetical protein